MLPLAEFSFSCQLKGTKKHMHSQNVVGLKSYTATDVILELDTHVLRDFIAVDSPLKLESKQQPRYSTIR